MNRGATGSYLASSAIVRTSGQMVSLQSLVVCPGALAGSVKLYNGTDGNGQLFFQVDTIANGQGFSIPFSDGLEFKAGLYIALSNCTCSVSYW